MVCFAGHASSLDKSVRSSVHPQPRDPHKHDVLPMHLIGNRAPFFLYINLTVQKAMKYGFIGIGTLAEAIIDGLIGTKLSVDSVIVSPRNAQVSARLAARHGVVTIASHNQAVVDNSDMVFIAVRPQVVESVLTSLKFPKGQHVVSLVAATSTQNFDRGSGPIRSSLKPFRCLLSPHARALRPYTPNTRSLHRIRSIGQLCAY